MNEHRVMPLLAALCLVLSGIHKLDAQQPEDSADLVFLIDGSNNVGHSGFNSIRDFLVNYVERRLEVGRSRIQVGVVQFSDDVKIEFTLDEHTSKRELISAMKSLQFAGGEESNLGAAVEYVVEQLFSSAGGSRREEGVPQSLVVITGGPASDELRDAANALKLNSIITFCIGVARADTNELQQIATDDSFVFTTSQFQAIGQMEAQIVPYIAGVAQRTIVLQPPTIITEVTEVNKRDIVFLIDSSSDLGGPSYSAIREFIVKLVNRLEIGLDLIRVGLAQYGRDVKPEFYLNTFGAKKDVIAHLKKMRILNTTPLNTGAALSNVQRNFFTASAGSRVDEGIPQLLVVITGGRSRDDISQASQNLKRAGILTFSIGAKNAEDSELQDIAFDSTLVFKPAEFKQVPLQSLLPQVLAPLRTLTGVVVTEGPTEVLNQRDIVFLLDGSVNVGSSNFPLVRDFLVNVINNLGVSSEGTRVGLAQFSDTPRTEFYLSTLTSKPDLIERLGQLRIKGGNLLNIGSAIQFVLRNHFTRSAGSRIEDKIPQLLVVLAAGKSTDNIQSAAVDLTRSGVLTFCIGVGNADKEELETIAFNPSLVYEMDDFEALPGFSQQLITPITTYVRGEVTEVTVTTDEDIKKDVVFLIDGSDAAISGFSSLRSFIQRVVEYLNVGRDKVRIAVVQYSNTVRPMFLLNTHSDQQDVIRAIQSMTPIRGSPLNIGAAISYAASNVFTQSAGSRAEEGVPQFLVLLATGKSRDDVRRPAMSLKRTGIVPYAIGTGSADRTELLSIAFTPDFVLYFPDVSELENAYQTFSQRVSTITTSEISTIAQTVATDDISKRKDIVFLIDGSNDGRSSFPSLRSFIQRVVENLDVGQDRIRIGVVQYSDSTRPSFLLNAHPDGQGVLRAIQQLSPIGGSTLNTGAALDYVTSNVFTSAAGSRSAEGVPQFLVLLTTARSRDDVRRPATDLKNSGVIPFSIGVRNADAGEMRTISFIPDFAITVPDVSQLGTVYQTFTRRVSELQAGDIEILMQSRPTVTVQGAKRDVVFLVDGSRGAASEFNNVKSLIERVVATMDVSPDTTRVAVVQYSEDPKVEFLLNAHSTKEEVQSAVRRIRPKGGSSVNTGNALEYVSKNIFTRPSGSRIEEQVPQFLIVASSGPSSDDVSEGARAIKESSVFPFVIGKNIDNDEARKITFGQDYTYSVSSFQELPSLEQRLLSSVTRLDQNQITEIILRQSGTTADSDPDRRDVVFLIDSSTKTGADGTANIRDFILKVVQNFEIAPNKVRVGLVQFSNNPTTEFLLKTYMNKPALTQNIRRLRNKGGEPLNIGRALDFVTKNHFVKSAGSRIEEGVPQYLVLLTGGKSEDDVTGAARILGTSRIRSLAVASGSSDRDEVQRIVSDPRYLFTVREFKDLSNIENVLFRSFTSPVDPTLPPSQPELPINGKKEADIVFLVDGSMNLGRDNFKEVLEFVSGIADALVEEEGAIQIALAQFNSDVTDEFFLREYKTREEIMEAVSKAEYKGGRVANLGAAIRHLQDKHFVKPAGSRIDTNVPQIAFIVTGAKSVSDGQAAAQALSGRGVKVFAIGVGSIDVDEVSKITSDAPSAFRVPVVQQLSELNEQILITLETALQKRSVCPGVVDGVRDCNLEVIIGFDSEVSSGQNLFNTYRGLESKLRHILERISNMQKISCSGDKKPTVKVAILSQGRTGPVEAFDFSEYRQELTEKILAMGTRGPYVLSSQTLQTYLNKFKTSGEDNSLKVIIHITDGADASMAELQKASLSLQTAGVRALLFVGMESTPKFDQIMQLEFGRGFTYNNPLRLNRVDLDYEIIEELDNIAEKGCCGVPCKCSGERGDIGSPGVTGPKGAPGLKGHQGFPGEEGGPGERGPPGTNGTQGFRGCPGQRGFKGSRGFSGDKGEVGEIGLDGIDGEDGKRGTPGSAGDRGSQGPRGEKGQKGQRGERGDQGLRGDPGEPGTDSTQRGSRGPKGEAGSVGEPGRDGPAGQPGGPGKAGGPGRRGPPGLKGNRGGAGAAGGVGEQGLRGPQGPLGQIGTPGTRGEQGLPGPRGAGGTPGAAGDRGRPGPLGRKGEPGDIGAKGSDGPVGPRGETGDDGRDGVGKPGPKGRKGETGFPGYPGVKGDPGDKGTNGDPGPKGSRGRRGNAGDPGTLGTPGDPGYPGPSGLKGERGGARDHCGLVKHIKNTCPCCYGAKECPVYPTDLVFAIDSSTDVNRNQFNNMKDAVLRMVNQLTITDSNCPRGARVALLTYNSEVTTEVRFSEGLRKPAMLKVIEDLQLKTNTKQRSLDTVMSFVARNTFKRARGGFLARKVAVFFSNAPTRASGQLNEAVLKLYDAGVASVFLTNREDRALGNALKVNNTEVGQAFVLGSGAQINDTIRRIFSCHVCLDICDPPSECGVSVPRGDLRLRRSAATDVDIDLAFLLDSSDSTNPAQFAEVKRFVSYVIGQLELSTEPKSSSHHARIAVLQHAPYEHQANASYSPVKVDVGLTDYTNKEKLQAFIKTKMTQLYGTRALSNAIKYVVEHVFEGAPNPRTMKVIFLFLTGEVKPHELQKLHQTVIEAKCKGYFFVILSIGKKVNSGQLHSLASEPHDVFSKKADKASELHEETLMRFGLHLPGFLSSENAFHLSPEIRKHCDWFQNDRPASTSQDATDNDETQNAVIPDELLTSKTPEVITVRGSTETPTDRTVTTHMTSLPMPEVLASDVTDSSVYLSWARADLQKPDAYELSITSLEDNTLVLKQNVTGTERLIGGLISGQVYQVTVTGQHKNLGLITYQTTFTTRKSEPQTEVVANSDMLVSTEPMDTPEIAVEKTMQLPTLESKAIAVGPEACKLPKEEGTCREFALKWYYDSETNSCARFWYGGCGGNENRFSTQKECEKICISAPLNPSVVSAIGT